ncbi:MAG: DUF4129 domain-containing protein [Nocardia sp.]|nr:DUF4129 domain-containing protein [Nocardia sp.]
MCLLIQVRQHSESSVAAVRTAIPRATGLVALMACVVVALRGQLPGSDHPLHAQSQPSSPSVVAIALMPVLTLVSVVILLAGVLTSQHRLPLAMAEDDRDRKRRNFRLGRFGVAILLAGTALTAVAALMVGIYLLVGGRPHENAPAPPTATAAPTPTAAPATPTPQPGPFSETPGLNGAALVMVGIAAAVLVAVAIIGLVVVTVTIHRRGAGPGLLPPPAAEDKPVSLAEVAEMGLAAMMASGQDPRGAIISCYGAMESGLTQARSAVPLVSDTPSEVLARAFDRGALHDASARELVTLFEEARFSPHAMLNWQRLRAEQLLRIVMTDLQGAQL